MAQAQRYDWADFMRGLMMFLVVLYHSEVYYFNSHTWSWVFEPFFLTGFFFISGYLFTRDFASVTLSGKIKQVVRAILVPYFIFTVGLALPKIVMGRADNTQLIIDIITLRASWFVIAIGVMQILFAVTLMLKRSEVSLVVATLAMFGIGYASVLIYRENPSWLIDNPWLNSDELPKRFPLCLNLALVQTPFFLLGILFRKYEPKLPTYLVGGRNMFVAATLLYAILYLWIDNAYIGSRMCVVVHSYNNILLVYLYAVIAIWALMCFSKMCNTCKPLNYLGKYSILFYFLNAAALTLVSAIVKKVPFMDPSNYINQIVVAVLATALMFPCVGFINKYLPIMSGNKDSFNKLSKKIGLKINW